MARAGGLGRGLSALIPSAGPETSGLLTLGLGVLVPNPRQPRTAFDPAALAELAHSLREIGMLQPILVRPRQDGRYEIIAGERRYRAALLAGLDSVPAIVRHTADAQLLTEALVENIHRADLNPLEEAAAYDQLLNDFGMTHDGLAARLGRSRSAITNALRLRALPAGVQQRVLAGTLSAGHARALLPLAGSGAAGGERHDPEDADRQERVAQRVVAQALSVRATEELVRGLLSAPPDGRRAAADDVPTNLRRPSPYEDLERRLAAALATTVRIAGTSRRGRVVIDYAGAEDLQRILDVIGRGCGLDLRDA